MNHLPWMLERGAASSSSGNAPEPCGHALMASCPPEPFSELTPDIPFGNAAHTHNNRNHNQHNQHNQQQQQQQHYHPASNPTTGAAAAAAAGGTETVGGGGENAGTWQLSKSDLATLLDLSKRLNLEGEITPVMAWGMVLAHPRVGEMRAEDFARLAEELGGKVRCYGYVFLFFFFFFNPSSFLSRFSGRGKGKGWCVEGVALDFFLLWCWIMLTGTHRFGAVMEEFEVRDALENVFSMRPEFGGH